MPALVEGADEHRQLLEGVVVKIGRQPCALRLRRRDRKVALDLAALHENHEWRQGEPTPDDDRDQPDDQDHDANRRHEHRCRNPGCHGHGERLETHGHGANLARDVGEGDWDTGHEGDETDDTDRQPRPIERREDGEDGQHRGRAEQAPSPCGIRMALAQGLGDEEGGECGRCRCHAEPIAAHRLVGEDHRHADGRRKRNGYIDPVVTEESTANREPDEAGEAEADEQGPRAERHLTYPYYGGTDESDDRGPTDEQVREQVTCRDAWRVERRRGRENR